jgi:hypothetical protein
MRSSIATLFLTQQRHLHDNKSRYHTMLVIRGLLVVCVVLLCGYCGGVSANVGGGDVILPTHTHTDINTPSHTNTHTQGDADQQEDAGQAGVGGEEEEETGELMTLQGVSREPFMVQAALRNVLRVNMGASDV